MASKGGPRASGSDGSDFSHREKVASHYQASATYKTRLKFSIFNHFLIFVLLFSKVFSSVLDQLGIDVHAIQNLHIPEPLAWEWIWLSSIVFAFVGLLGIRRNKILQMKIYAWGTFFFSLCPVVGAAIYFLDDLLSYLQSQETQEIAHLEKWQGFPIAVVWYVFIVVAFQVHMFSLYFSVKLMEAWLPKLNKKIR